MSLVSVTLPPFLKQSKTRDQVYHLPGNTDRTRAVIASIRKRIYFLAFVNPLMGTGNYSATSNNTKLAYRPLMGVLLHFVQQGGAPPHCTKCNSLSINGQCNRIVVRRSAVLMRPR